MAAYRSERQISTFDWLTIPSGKEPVRINPFISNLQTLLGLFNAVFSENGHDLVWEFKTSLRAFRFGCIRKNSFFFGV